MIEARGDLPGGYSIGILAEDAQDDGCPFRKSHPDVLMVQSSQDRNGDNGARSLNCSMRGRIFP
jgi:hypothetical protein